MCIGEDVTALGVDEEGALDRERSLNVSPHS